MCGASTRIEEEAGERKGPITEEDVTELSHWKGVKEIGEGAAGVEVGGLEKGKKSSLKATCL